MFKIRLIITVIAAFLGLAVIGLIAGAANQFKIISPAAAAPAGNQTELLANPAVQDDDEDDDEDDDGEDEDEEDEQTGNGDEGEGGEVDDEEDEDDEADEDSGFEELVVYMEQNATDDDAEVILAAEAGDEGLSQLTITAPNGKQVVNYSAPDASTLGIREFNFESPEPGLEAVKAAYPEGIYMFQAMTFSGQVLTGTATLSHELPITTSFILPAEQATDVPTENLVVSWAQVPGVSGYLVEIEQDDLDANLTARFPASITSLTVPAGFLSPGVEYELGVATINAAGNISFIETTFTTAQ